MFVITMFRYHSFYYRCSDLSYCFRRTGTRPGGGAVSFPNSPATVQITLSSVKPCLSVWESDCFCDLWNETLIHNSMQFVLVRVFVLFISIPVGRSLGPSQQPVTPVCGNILPSSSVRPGPLYSRPETLPSWHRRPTHHPRVAWHCTSLTFQQRRRRHYIAPKRWCHCRRHDESSSGLWTLRTRVQKWRRARNGWTLSEVRTADANKEQRLTSR